MLRTFHNYRWEEADLHRLPDEFIHWDIWLHKRSAFFMVNGKHVVQGANVHNGIAIEVGMASAIGAAMINTKRLFDGIELLDARANLLDSSFVCFHGYSQLFEK